MQFLLMLEKKIYISGAATLLSDGPHKKVIILVHFYFLATELNLENHRGLTSSQNVELGLCENQCL